MENNYSRSSIFFAPFSSVTLISRTRFPSLISPLAYPLSCSFLVYFFVVWGNTTSELTDDWLLVREKKEKKNIRKTFPEKGKKQKNNPMEEEEEK